MPEGLSPEEQFDLFKSCGTNWLEFKSSKSARKGHPKKPMAMQPSSASMANPKAA